MISGSIQKSSFMSLFRNHSTSFNKEKGTIGKRRIGHIKLILTKAGD